MNMCFDHVCVRVREAAALYYYTRRRCARENSAEDVMGFCMVDPLHTPRQTCSAMGFPGKTMNTAFNDEIEAVRPYDWCVTTPWVFHTAHPMHAILTPHAPSYRSGSPSVKLRPGNRILTQPRCGTNNYIAFWCSVAGGNGHMPGPHIGRSCEIGTEWDDAAKLCQACDHILCGHISSVCALAAAPLKYALADSDSPSHCGRTQACPVHTYSIMTRDTNLNYEQLRPRDMPSVISSCVPCPHGRACPGATGCAYGADTDDCPPKISCGAGTFWDSETAACLPCAADTYKVGSCNRTAPLPRLHAVSPPIGHDTRHTIHPPAIHTPPAYTGGHQ